MKLNSGQRFKIEISLVFNILNEINNNVNNIDEIRNNLGIGKNKVETYNYYLRIMDLVEYNNKKFKLTKFGRYILRFKDNLDIYLPLLFYKLCRGWDNGGHFYYSRIVNNILYDKYYSGDNTIENSEIKEKLMDFEFEYDKIDVKLVTLVTTGISSDDGFGHLGMLTREEKSKFIINYYKPKPLIAAYIIYDIWPNNVTSISFEKIINDEYSLGRIFLLTEDDIIPILSKLHQDNYIKIEDKAGLKQIVKNSNISADMILEEIYNVYFSNTFTD